MYLPLATVFGAAVIAGSIVWASEEQAAATKCAAYISTETGSLSITALAQGKDTNAARAGYAALVYAGCPFPIPDHFRSTPSLLREFGNR